MSDITLSTGIRQNLLSLQKTSADLTTTQEALSTGNKVNSAADNPSAYFTSQNLTNNANALSALLDQIGQGQQTINAATDGLTGLTSLLQQALSTAQQAQQAATGTLSYTAIQGTQSIGADSTQATSNTFSTSGLTAATLSTTSTSDADIAGVGAGDTLIFQIGSNAAVTATQGTNFTTGATLATYLTAQLGTEATVTDSAGTLSVTSNSVGSNVVAVSGTGAAGAAFSAPTTGAAGSILTLTDQGGQTTTLDYVASDTNANATANGTFSNLATLVLAANAASNNTHGEITATSTGGGTTLTLASTTGNAITVGGDVGTALGFNATAYNNNYNASLAAAVGANDTLTVQVGSNAAHTLTFGTGAGDVSTLAGLNSALGAFGDITAAVTSGKLTLTPTGTSTVTVGGSAVSTFGIATSTTPVANVVTPSSTRATLQANYNSLLTQIDQLAGDASYNGVNLLNGDNLVVDFNPSGSSSLTIAGVNDSSTGLGLGALSNSEFQDNTSIGGIVSDINNAISNVQAQTETFGTNSGTITTRQTFETALINTLQTGASNLVAADQNQESADLLTEQTQQQLEISALSIANQANQSVLKLFG
jgi:flagellin